MSPKQSSGTETNTNKAKQLAARGRAQKDQGKQNQPSNPNFCAPNIINRAPTDNPNSPSRSISWKTVHPSKLLHRHSFDDQSSLTSRKKCYYPHGHRFWMYLYGYKCKGEGCEKYICKGCYYKNKRSGRKV
ncbi:hypothetical protein LTS10_007053 [Elasticomyces elasticus]|nr:hypothetical protein LTS10_007053 [Elasticomyces elasticus]